MVSDARHPLLSGIYLAGLGWNGVSADETNGITIPLEGLGHVLLLLLPGSLPMKRGHRLCATVS